MNRESPKKTKGYPGSIDTVSQDDSTNVPMIPFDAMKPSKFTARTLAIIVNKLSRGFPLNAALARARIPQSLFRQWIEKESNGNARYAQLANTVEIARGTGIDMLHERLLDLAMSDGKLLLEILRVLDPSTYAPRTIASNLVQGNMKIELVMTEGKRVTSPALTVDVIPNMPKSTAIVDEIKG